MVYCADARVLVANRVAANNTGVAVKQREMLGHRIVIALFPEF